MTKSQLSKAMELTHTPRHDKAGRQIGLGWFIAKEVLETSMRMAEALVDTSRLPDS